MNPWLAAAAVIAVVAVTVAVGLILAAGSRDIATCWAEAGLCTGGAMTAAGAALLYEQRRRAEAELDTAVAAETARLDDELAVLLERGGA